MSQNGRMEQIGARGMRDGRREARGGKKGWCRRDGLKC